MGRWRSWLLQGGARQQKTFAAKLRECPQGLSCYPSLDCPGQELPRVMPQGRGSTDPRSAIISKITQAEVVGQVPAHAKQDHWLDLIRKSPYRPAVYDNAASKGLTEDCTRSLANSDQKLLASRAATTEVLTLASRRNYSVISLSPLSSHAWVWECLFRTCTAE